ncbi:MAG: hypothetical protein WD942_00560 [Dehalococcoidia bacterium]
MQEIVGLSKDAYRHWKKVLPPIAQRGGRAPCFSLGDLIAASVVYRLTVVAGVRVGHLADLSVSIFELCNTSSWTVLEGATLTIDIESRACRIDTRTPAKAVDLLLFCRLESILGELRNALLKTQGDRSQCELRFPPTAVRAAPDRRRRRA